MNAKPRAGGARLQVVKSKAVAPAPTAGTAAETGKNKGSSSRAASGEDAGKIFDAYVERKNPQLKNLAQELRRFVRKTLFGSRETINPWGIPTFDYFGPVSFLMIGKRHVTFGFTRGTSLADPTGLLEGTGKNLRHVKLTDVAQLRDPNLRKMILEAAALNRANPLTETMRAKKV